MTILVLADEDSVVFRVQCDHVDVLACCGDLQDATIARARLYYKPRWVIGVRGNHDGSAPFAPGITDLHLRVHVIDGIKFGGFAGSWRYKPRGHHLFEQDEVISRLSTFPPVDIFIAHNSPWGIHERDSHTHQGFVGFNTYVKRTNPRCFLHGHQHVDSVTLLGGTTIIAVYGEKLVHLANS